MFIKKKLMIEFNSLEKKYEELLIENNDLIKKIANCEDELNYYMGEEHYKDFFSYFMTDFSCSVCNR